jgi:hypothetical protein
VLAAYIAKPAGISDKDPKVIPKVAKEKNMIAMITKIFLVIKIYFFF